MKASMTKRAAILISVLLVATGTVRSQLEHWPKHTIAFHYGHLVAAPMKAFNTYGQQHDLNTRAGRGSSIGLEYGLRISNGILLGAGVQMTGIGQRFDLSFLDPTTSVANNGINAPPIRPGRRWMRGETPEVTLMVGKVLHASPRWSTSAAFVAGLIPMWSSIHFKDYRWSPIDPEQPIFHIETEEGLDIFPTVGLRFQVNWQARNHNRWSLLIDARTTLGNFYNGQYSLYPGTDQAGGGSLRGRLAYARIGVAYGLTWGAPRKPKWLRLQEQAAPRQGAE
jgi:hypothetical protein